ncbi:MAG: hypothetical protein JNK58_12070 [Phycisphaerae bacterium]|nr:hypothetical protein [Phycisphaerae bacterium]
MKRAPRHGRRFHVGRLFRRATFFGIASILAGGVLWCGCTVTSENYSTLSFFFDGVKDPNAPGPDGIVGDSTVAVAVLVHQPYAEDKCEACHKTSYRPSRNDGSPCLACHDSIASEHRWVHGAVAGGACLWCHAPHESARKWLLRGPDRKICAQCHSATLMVSTSVPEHTDPAASCLQCHMAHGGETPLMLRTRTGEEPPPVPRPVPPAAPASEAAPDQLPIPDDPKEGP